MNAHLNALNDLNARPAFYDDSGFNYREVWAGRDYEHQAEVIALRRLLAGQRFDRAVDVGGGYGRLSVVLAEFASRVTLVDSSSQQLELASEFLAGHPAVDKRLMDAAKLDFPDQSVDLVAMVRVLHHLPDPAAELAEVGRILRPGGTAIVEVANVAHALNRIRHLARREPLPFAALDIRSEQSRKQGGIPFVNHHPVTIGAQFAAAGLETERVLSVSNLRHPVFKKALPERARLLAERMAQARLARMQFGPSLFFLLRREPDATHDTDGAELAPGPLTGYARAPRPAQPAGHRCWPRREPPRATRAGGRGDEALLAWLLPVSAGLSDLPTVQLDEPQSLAISRGQTIQLNPVPVTGRCAASASDGTLLALLELDADGRARILRGFNLPPD